MAAGRHDSNRVARWRRNARGADQVRGSRGALAHATAARAQHVRVCPRCLCQCRVRHARVVRRLRSNLGLAPRRSKQPLKQRLAAAPGSLDCTQCVRVCACVCACVQVQVLLCACVTVVAQRVCQRQARQRHAARVKSHRGGGGSAARASVCLITRVGDAATPPPALVAAALVPLPLPARHLSCAREPCRTRCARHGEPLPRCALARCLRDRSQRIDNGGASQSRKPRPAPPP